MIDINLAENGCHLGRLYLPHSTDNSAFGRIETPIAFFRNGSGPTILCLGGVHGDEYVGQAVLNRLVRILEPDRVRGQIIILPAAHVAAATAGTRVSPIDHLNLNRIFPGKSNGSPSERLAHFLESELIARSDLLIDLHGGASSSLYLPGPTVSWSDTPQVMEHRIELLRVFGGAQGYILQESRGGEGGTAGSCMRHGVERLGTEIGGGGMIFPGEIRMMHTGLLRVLAHLGSIEPTYLDGLPEPQRPRILCRKRIRDGGFTYAPETGLFEPLVELGDMVTAGQHVGDIHMPEAPEAPIVPIHAVAAGIVMTRHRLGRTRRGDCLMVVAEDFTGTGQEFRT